MRSRVSFLATLCVVGFLSFPIVAQAGIPFLGPIIPPPSVSGVSGSDVCPAGWGMLITVINNIISLLITLAIIFVAPLMIAWAGFLLVVSQGDSGKRTQARKILTNTIIGIVLALAGYMIIAAIMAVLYNPGATSGKTTLGAWADIIGSRGEPFCLKVAGSLKQAVPGTGVTAGVITQVGKAPGPCSSSNTACSTNIIQQGAQALNMNLTTAQATTMSCIAMSESRGNPWSPESETGACGTFQITNRPGNWSNPEFHKGSCSKDSSCNDPQCNLQTALLMLGQRGYQPWTGKKPDGTYWNANAVACVQQYDPNTTLRTI
jgi:hypothetical protein